MQKVNANYIQIESIRLDDIEDVLKIEIRCFSNPWNKKTFEQELKNSFSRIFLLKETNKSGSFIKGYVCLWLVIDEAQILKIGVHPNSQHKGYAHRLLQFTLNYLYKKHILTAYLEVSEKNWPALYLYQKFGFTQIGLRNRYYKDTGENALVMKLDIPSFFSNYNNRAFHRKH